MENPEKSIPNHEKSIALLLLLFCLIATGTTSFGVLIFPSGTDQVACAEIGTHWFLALFLTANLATILDPFYTKKGRIRNTICLVLTTPFIWFFLLICMGFGGTGEGICVPAAMLVAHVALVTISQLAYFYSWQFSANSILTTLLGAFVAMTIFVVISDSFDFLPATANFIFCLSNYILFLAFLFGIRLCFSVPVAKQNWKSLAFLFATILLMIILYSAGWMDQINSREYSQFFDYFLGTFDQKSL